MERYDKVNTKEWTPHIMERCDKVPVKYEGLDTIDYGSMRYTIDTKIWTQLIRMTRHYRLYNDTIPNRYQGLDTTYYGRMR